MSRLETLHPWLRGGMLVLGHIARLVLGVVFLWAGALKAPDPMGFARDIAQYGIVTGSAATVFAFLLIPVEVALGCALLLNFRSRLGLAIASALMVMFIAAISYALATGQPLEDCGCFGSNSPRTPQQTLTEDAVFLALGLAGIAGLGAGPRKGSVVARRWKAALLAATAAGSGAFVVAAPHLPIDDLATRLAPGVAWASLEVALPEVDLTQGAHLVALLRLTDDASLASMDALNGLAQRLPLVGLHSDDEAVYNQFFWTHGPAFELHYLATSDMRSLHRGLPRFFAVRDGVVTATWSEVPPESEAARALGMGS